MLFIDNVAWGTLFFRIHFLAYLTAVSLLLLSGMDAPKSL